jgi:hypothetical protein
MAVPEEVCCLLLNSSGGIRLFRVLPDPVLTVILS